MKKIRILVSEFITGGGFVDLVKFPDSLRSEGEMMLRSVLADLSDLNGLEIWVTRDQRFDQSGFSKDMHIVNIREGYVSEFTRLCQQVDVVLPIAPESDGTLEILSRCVLAQKKKLLGSRPDTVRVCASKLATVKRLAEHNVPVVESITVDSIQSGSEFPKSSIGWIVKPDMGVGSEQVFYSRSKKAIVELATTIKKAVIQPYLAGISASLSLLCRDGRCVVIGYNEQMINSYSPQDPAQSGGLQYGQLQYGGSKVNSLNHFRSVLDPVAASVASIFPGLWGYVGLDLVIVEGSRPIILEINPRITTSYSGLRESTNINPAAMILSLLQQPLPEMVQFSEQIRSKLKEVDVFVSQ